MYNASSYMVWLQFSGCCLCKWFHCIKILLLKKPGEADPFKAHGLFDVFDVWINISSNSNVFNRFQSCVEATNRTSSQVQQLNQVHRCTLYNHFVCSWSCLEESLEHLSPVKKDNIQHCHFSLRFIFANCLV